MKRTFIFVLLFVALSAIAQKTEETIDYHEGDMYQVFFNGETPITRPAGQVKFLSYNKFYKSYTILFKTQDTEGINATTFSYLSETMDEGKTIIYYIESSSKDVYFASPDTLEKEGNILFIRKEPLEGVIYGIAIKNLKK